MKDEYVLLGATGVLVIIFSMLKVLGVLVVGWKWIIVPLLVPICTLLTLAVFFSFYVIYVVLRTGKVF